MLQNTHAPGERIAGRDAANRDQAALLDVHGLADLLACSPRHVNRLADAGRVPRPVRLGALVRWPRAVVEDWVARGCPSCRRQGASR